MLYIFQAILLVAQAKTPADAVKKAIEKTAGASYSYKVNGKYDRTGEFKPAGALTARIHVYQSGRNGEVILVKGPEGLWKTPGEQIGERTDKIDPEVAEIVRTLEEAEPPHKILLDLLPILEEGRKLDDRDVEGTPCHTYQFTIRTEPLRTSLEKRIAKAAEKPDEIRWPTLRGSLRIHVSTKEGFLTRAVDERKVTLVYKNSGAEELKTYKNEFIYDISGHGKAPLSLPKEVQERLGLKEE